MFEMERADGRRCLAAKKLEMPLKETGLEAGRSARADTGRSVWGPGGGDMETVELRVKEVRGTLGQPAG